MPRRRGVEAEERFRRAFDDSAIGMALVSVEADSAGRVIDANDAICAITGHDREALLQTSFEIARSTPTTWPR